MRELLKHKKFKKIYCKTPTKHRFKNNYLAASYFDPEQDLMEKNKIFNFY